MTGDISAYLFDPRQAYTSVRLQQGRVITDLDWNENERLAADAQLRLLADLVCGRGSTNDGFRLLGAQPASVAVPGRGERLAARTTYDVRLSGGTFLLGGHLHAWPGIGSDPGFGQTFLNQDDWLQLGGRDAAALPPPPEDGRVDLVYLNAFEHPVRAVEDRELLERALGGPDTSTRLKAIRRVAILPDAGDTCAEAAAALRDFVTRPAAGDNSGVRHGFDPTLGEVRSKARLTVGFTGDNPALDPCRPRTSQGYLGAENQAIRIELVAGNRFLWAYDNAEPLYRVEISDATPGADGSIELRFLNRPRDPMLFPFQGAVIEILPWGALLANGEKAADARGHLARVTASFDPGASTLRAAPAVPFEMQAWLNSPDRDPILNPLGPDDPPRYFYARLWQPGPEGSPDVDHVFTPGAAVALPGTGLSVSFADFGIPGDHWVIAARPNTPDRVVPWRLLDSAPPFGPRRFYSSLGLVRWGSQGTELAATVEDCRHRFRKLCSVESCCTVHVGDGSASQGEVNDLQAAIDMLPPEGGRICLLPGTHVAAARLVDRRNVVIEGCGSRSRIVAGPGQTAPVIDIERCEQIALRDLAVAAVDALLIEAHTTGGLRLERLDLAARARAAVIATACQFVELIDSRIVQAVLAEPAARTGPPQEPAVFLAGFKLRVLRNEIRAERGRRALLGALGGLQIGGDSEDVEIADNLIQGGTGPGIVLGSIDFQPRRTLRDAALLRTYFSSRVSRPAQVGRWSLADNDCLTIDPRPRPPRDPARPDPLDPISDGPVEDCRILRNRILDMGGSGITVAYWFVPEDEIDAIVTDRLLIEANRISRCMRLPVAAIPPELVEIAGFGGIALALGVDLTIRDNEINDVGTNHAAPIVGIYILDGEAVTIQRNRLRDNGRIAGQESTIPIGRTGAILLGTVRPGVDRVPLGRLVGARQDGAPALLVEDNVAIAREGRALTAVGVGPMVIHGNQFTAHGSNSLRHEPAGAVQVTGRSFSMLSDDGLAARRTTANPLTTFMNAMGGAAVAILNLGVSNEIYLQLSGLSGLGQIDTEQPGREGLGDDVRLLANGNIQFNDNQVMLDNIAPAVTVAASSILLFSLDDVAMQDNQCDCDMVFDVVMVNALVLGFSVRVQGNRLKESFYTTFLSAMTIGLFNDTSHNQGTHCFFHYGVYEPRILLSGVSGQARLDTNRHLASAEQCEQFGAQSQPVSTAVGVKSGPAQT